MADFVVVGGVPIKVSPSSGKADWNDAVDRRRSFDNTYRASATGGAARDWHFSTPPITRAVAGTYRAVLSQIQAQMCSGEGLELPTMCCAELIGETPVKGAASNYVALDFALHESQSKRLLLKYAPGDTITGESFTRASDARQFALSGVWLLAGGNNIKRDGHYVNGVRSTLLEDARTNSCLRCSDLTNAVWAKSGTGTATINASALDGTTTGTTIADTDAAGPTSWTQGITVPVNSNTHCVSFWILQDAVSARFPLFNVQITGGTSVARAVALNTQTGATALNNAVGTGSHRVVAVGGWWVLEITVTNNGTASNTALAVVVYPAYGTTINVLNNAATGSMGVSHVQVELNASFYSSPIFTTTAAVTRAADSYSLPFTTPPQEMTVYAKFVEGGTINTAAARVYHIGDASSNAPNHLVYTPSIGYVAYHNNNAGGIVISVVPGAPVIGNTVEVMSRVFGDGSDDITQSINAAAATSGPQSAAAAFATAWSAQLAWLNSVGSLTVGFTALQSFKIVAGSRSLAEMRAA